MGQSQSEQSYSIHTKIKISYEHIFSLIFCCYVFVFFGGHFKPCKLLIDF